MSNVNHEMVVSAKIVTMPEFKVPEVTTEEISITSANTVNDIYKKINQIKQANKSGCIKINIPKGFGPATDSALDIFYKWDTEGPIQAIVTGVGSTATAVGIVALAGLSSPVTASGIILASITYSAVNLIASHLYDGIWDYGEQIVDLYRDQNGKAIIDTSVSNLSDLRELVTPLYGAAADCDLNEIEVRVKPENEGDEPLTYLIKKGDTVWDLCQKYDTTYDELIELNPWLSERFSDDKEFCLIRPGETLKIPCKGSGILDVKPTYDTGFKIAGEVKHVVDPMFLDLNKDGVLGTTSVSDGIYFDHEGDGFAESSAWVDKEDGVLVIDKNNDGKIDNGNEVFGDNYVKLNGRKAKNGFEALADLDSNNDGIINASDSEFNNIKILKGDGTLLTLQEAGIVSINLNKTEVNKEDENGNVLVYESTFTYEDGSIGKLGTFNLGVDKMLSEEVNKVEVSNDVKLLPDIKGYGKVHSLHQAIMLDESGSLKSLVQSFVNTEDIKLKKEILVDILHKWTGADKIRDNSRGEYYSAQKLHILEKFMGVGFVGLDSGKNPNNQASYFLKSSFNNLVNDIYARLQAQTGLKNVFDLVEGSYDFESNAVTYDLTKAMGYVDNLITENEASGKELLGDFTTCLVYLGFKKQSNFVEYVEHYAALGEEYSFIVKDCFGKVVINGTEGDDKIEGTYTYEAIFGGAGNDTILSGDGNDFVFGGEGADSINGGEGNDVIQGGAGNDTITGGSGHDLIYGGDGDDVLDPGELGCDTIYGGAGNDTIKRNGGNHGEAWYFDGEDGEDYIEGGLGRNTLIGGRGNDTIIARGTDVVYGGDGNDSIETSSSSYINGGEGNDTINFLGYTENPTIEGARGDDYINVTMGTYPSSGTKIQTTFVYNLGDGNDTITSALSYIKSFEFGEGITRENIRFTPSYPRDVLITFEGHEGSIFVTGLAGGSSTNIEGFLKFADGTSWSWWDILVRLKIEGTDGDDSISGSGASEKIYGYDGNDTINGNNGPDTIYGGNGNDSISANGTIYGEDGDDTIRPNGGNYYVDGGNGNDSIIVDSYGTNSTIVGGKGDDFISVSKNYWASSSAQTKILYKYNLGDGNDTIQSSQATNTIEFGEGIREEDVIFRTEDRDIVICFKNHEGSIRVKNGIYDNCKINNYVYTDKNTVSEAANDAAMGIEYAPDFNVNKIIQDMAAYNTTEDAMISYSNDINQEKELMTLVNSSM